MDSKTESKLGHLGAQWIAEIIGDVKKRRDNMQNHLALLKNEGYYKQAHVDALVVLNAMLSAAAPQVVADERAAFEEFWTNPFHGDNSCIEWKADGYLSFLTREAYRAWCARAALQAAMAQSQEPVAETYAHTMSNGRGRPDDPAPFETVCVRLLRNDLPADLKLYAAPVQPVAVPDGWKPEIFYGPSKSVFWGGNSCTKEQEAAKPEMVLIAYEDYKKACERIAAPAAQGDALNAKRYEYLRSDDEGIEFRDKATGQWRADCPSGELLDKIIDAAIAAKAAS